MTTPPTRSTRTATLFPYTTLFRSPGRSDGDAGRGAGAGADRRGSRTRIPASRGWRSELLRRRARRQPHGEWRDFRSPPADRGAPHAADGHEAKGHQQIKRQERNRSHHRKGDLRKEADRRYLEIGKEHIGTQDTNAHTVCIT